MTADGRYQELNPRQIVLTIARLRARFDERFPERGFGQVLRELETTASAAVDRTREILRPNLGLRAGIGLLLIALPIPIVLKIASYDLEKLQFSLPEFIQTLEAALGATFFLGAMALFLVTLESRLKRRRAITAIHELRAMAHIVDMHQLTKDPDTVLPGHVSTASSPERQMTPHELGRYLDYCSESLSLLAKIAALYGQHFSDAVVLEAVDQVEDLCARLSAKIWQKIDLLDQIRARK